MTPGSHADYLPTLSLLHSATLVIRVMREVKLREEEYVFVKDLLARIRGLPSSIQLVRRERRLVAHGVLGRIRQTTTILKQIKKRRQPDRYLGHKKDRGNRLDIERNQQSQ